MLKQEIIERYNAYKKENEEILDAFRKERGRKKYWYLKIKCLKHNHVFNVQCSLYKRGSGCRKCKIERQTLSKKQVEQDFLNYLKPNETLVDVYQKNRKNNKEWYGILNCNKHGTFEISKGNYKKGQGCPKCKIDKLTLCKEQVVQDFKDYLKPNETLINVYQKKDSEGYNRWWATVRCLKHGKFEIEKQHHKAGKGCPKCGEDKKRKKLTLAPQQVENDFKKQLKPNESLIKTYQKKNSKNHNEWRAVLLCSKHGEFEIRKEDHKRGQGCPQCSESKGERKIREYLLKNNINFKEQYRFKDCKYYKPLPFDFYIYEQNILIEYQGRQHYQPVDIFGGEEALKKQQKRDKIKKEYCQKNSIQLLEIPYTKYNNIEDILEELISL